MPLRRSTKVLGTEEDMAPTVMGAAVGAMDLTAMEVAAAEEEEGVDQVPLVKISGTAGCATT